MPKRPSARVSRLWSASAAIPSSASEPAHRLRGLEREAAGEHARARANSRLASGVEQVVAPADRGAQRLLALRRVARAAAEQVEPARRGGRGSSGGREDLDPRGGELDRQREPVEARGRSPRSRSVAGVERSRGSTRAGAALEQRDGGLGAPAAASASSCSAASRSGARLVTTSFERGEAARSALSSGAASSSCSKLSTTSSSSRPARLADRRSPSSAPTSARVVERAERDEARAVARTAGRAGARARARSASCRSRPARSA